MKLLLLPALVAASGLPVRRPLFASLPSHKPESPSWLLAATGRCTHQLYTELDEPGYKAHVEFEFLPSTTIQFTDAPFHQAFEIITPDDQIVQLADESWSYKNVALLEPDANGTDWAISTFEIEEHGISEDGDAVHYSGRVTTRSSNFPGVRNDTFPCQLFVDSNPGKCKMTCVLPARASAWGGRPHVSRQTQPACSSLQERETVLLLTHCRAPSRRFSWNIQTSYNDGYNEHVYTNVGKKIVDAVMDKAYTTGTSHGDFGSDNYKMENYVQKVTCDASCPQNMKL